MADFLTVEDVNSVVAEYYNVPFWSEVKLDIGNTADFDGIKFDYCTVDREYSNSKYNFTITVDNDLWKGQCYFIDDNEGYITDVSYSSGVITVESDTPNITAHFYMDMQGVFGFQLMDWIITEWTPKFERIGTIIICSFTIESVNPSFEPNGKTFNLIIDSESYSMTCSNNKVSYGFSHHSWVNFTCTYNGHGYTFYPRSYEEQMIIVSHFSNLIVGKINNLRFDRTDRAWDLDCLNLIADYPISNIIKNGGELYFDLDLRYVTTLKKINIQIDYEDKTKNEYAHKKFTFNTVPATVTTEAEISSLITNGGVGYLGANITLTTDLTVGGEVTLFGEGYNIDCDGYQFIVGDGKSLKFENLNIVNGVNTIQQLTGSNVELTDCSFTDCTSSDGVGGVIDCDVTLASLDNPTDFITTITNCTFTNCDCPILHGGELKVTNCQVIGKLSDYDFPYFLYQTDGSAVITQTQFNISNDTPVEEDIKFNSCIFTCGKKATINGLGYGDLQKNDIPSFLERNSSTIDLTYYYDSIEQNITLTASKGYCHAVSNISQIYKTNVEIIRGE